MLLQIIGLSCIIESIALLYAIIAYIIYNVWRCHHGKTETRTDRTGQRDIKNQ